MDPATLAIAHWLVSNVGLPVLNAGMDRLLVQMGIKESPSSRDQVLVEKYIQQLEKDMRQVKAKLDEDRLAKLRAALVQVSESQKTVARREYLTNALNNFHVVVNYPEHGLTGNYTNAQLRCIAFVGMAAAHTALNDSRSLVAEKVVEAVSADVDTAKEWLGEGLVNQILPLLPSSPETTCPKCGFQNPTGSKFCNRDGFPLNSGQRPSPQLLSQTSTLYLIRELSFVGIEAPIHVIIDDERIGALRYKKSNIFQIQAGDHVIFLHLNDYVVSPRITFYAAAGEKAMFSCQVKKERGKWQFSIQLQKL